MEKEKKWHPVPGFHYEISEDGEVRNSKSGRAIKIGADNRYILRRQGRTYTFTIGRLLYAVEQNTDPVTIEGMVIMVEGKPVLTTRAEYCKKIIVPFRHTTQKFDLVKRYRDYIDTATAMIDFYENGDMQKMTGLFACHESKIKGYMYSAGFTRSQDVIKEAWQSILSRVLSGVSDKKIFITDPYNYLRRCVRSYFSERRKERMLLRGLPETGKRALSYDELMEIL